LSTQCLHIYYAFYRQKGSFFRKNPDISGKSLLYKKLQLDYKQNANPWMGFPALECRSRGSSSIQLMADEWIRAVRDYYAAKQD
jgi:hypothetical protein